GEGVEVSVNVAADDFRVAVPGFDVLGVSQVAGEGFNITPEGVGLPGGGVGGGGVHGVPFSVWVARGSRWGVLPCERCVAGPCVREVPLGDCVVDVAQFAVMQAAVAGDQGLEVCGGGGEQFLVAGALV